MLINRKNLRNIKKKIIIKTIESNTKIMITMTNMNKIIIKINRNRSIFQNKKMIINIQMKMKNIMKKEIFKINQFSKHKVKMLINTIKMLKRISKMKNNFKKLTVSK